MSHLLDALLSVPAPWVLTAIGLLVFGEAAFFLGFVLPAEAAALVGAFFASTGRLQLLPLLAVVVLAAVVGDSVGYEVGRRFGPRLLSWRRLRRHEGRIAGAQSFLAGRGAPAVFIGRFTAFLRAVMPGLAGLSRMRYRRFLAYNVSGGLVWGSMVVLLGYFAGRSYRQVEQWMGTTGAIVFVGFAIVAVVVWRRARGRNAERAGREQETSGTV